MSVKVLLCLTPFDQLQPGHVGKNPTMWRQAIKLFLLYPSGRFHYHTTVCCAVRGVVLTL